MLLIPEIETVFIRVPRTASSSLKKAIIARYPATLEVYHHMEADGVPHGYDRWRRIGVVRNPVARLHSLYRFLSAIERKPHHVSGWDTRMLRSVQGISFSRWLADNETVFTSPYSSAIYGPVGNSPAFHPVYAVLHPLPENRKSQFLYLRPDLGTTVYRYETDLAALANDMALDWRPTAIRVLPSISITDYAEDHLRRVCDWEFEDLGYRADEFARVETLARDSLRETST
jgi:hypothetical protein